MSYHINCRAKYTSVTNLGPYKNKVPGVVDFSDIPAPETLTGCSTRCDSKMFDIRNHCFLCSKILKRMKIKGNWCHEKLTSVTTGTCECTHKDVQEAAKLRKDSNRIARMEIYTDLVAYDAIS